MFGFGRVIYFVDLSFGKGGQMAHGGTAHIQLIIHMCTHTRNADNALTDVVRGQEPAHASEEEEGARGHQVVETGVCACVCM